MVATQNFDTLSIIWTFSLRGVLTFVVLYPSVIFLVLSHEKIFKKYLQKCEGCIHFSEILYSRRTCMRICGVHYSCQHGSYRTIQSCE